MGKRVCVYSEAVQDREGYYKGLEWEIMYHQVILKREGMHSYDLETINKRRVELDDIRTFLPDYAGCQNCDVMYKYMSLASRPFGGFFARLMYYFVYKKDDNKPPYKGVMVTD